MNNIEKLQELRAIAIRKGFPKDIDKQFYIPVRTLTSGRSYIPANGDHTLLFDPEWLKSLLGDSPVASKYFDKDTLDYISMPFYESTMVELARIRATKGDTIGYLYNLVKKGE